MLYRSRSRPGGLRGLGLTLLLLAGGAAADATLQGSWSAALQAKDLDTLGRLLEAGADPNWTAQQGRTALMFAAEAGELGLVVRLLEAGAEVKALNRYHGSALMFAAKGGDPRVIARLLDAGADANRVADLGWTALLVAAAKGNTAAVTLLVDRGADANARDKNGWTPLMHAVSGRHAETVLAMLDLPVVDPELREENGSTALHIAALNGDAAIARALVEHGADPAATTARGYTAAQVATEARHPEVARMLEAAAARRDL